MFNIFYILYVIYLSFIYLLLIQKSININYILYIYKNKIKNFFYKKSKCNNASFHFYDIL